MTNLHQKRSSTSQSHVEVQPHSLPRRRTREHHGSRCAALDESAFVAIGAGNAALTATDVASSFLIEMNERILNLEAGKGGLLWPPETVFTVPSPWIHGYLGLVVDELRGEVRRVNLGAAVYFDPDSLAWTVFLAAWNGGDLGCSKREWEYRDDLLHDPIREKAIRRDVNKKLRILSIRLQPRRPPRLVECPTPTR